MSDASPPVPSQDEPSRLAAAGQWIAARTRALWSVSRPLLLRAWAWTLPRLRGAWRLLATLAWSGTERAAALLRAVYGPARRATRLALASAGAAGLLLGLGSQLFERVPADAIAVRQVQWAGGGIEGRDHAPGLHLRVPGRDLWHQLRAGTHLIVFAPTESGGTHARLEVATVGGETCLVSVVVPYRILPGEANLLVQEGMRTDYPVRAVAICRRVLLEELGTLTAEEFADPSARARVEAAMLGRLRTELAVAHLEPLDALIGEFFFDETYEQKMLERQLESQAQLTQASLLERHQQERLNTEERERQEDAEAALLREFALREEALRDAHAQRLTELERDARQEREALLAEAEVEALQLRNEGELALAAAEDLRRSLLDAALQSPGGRLHVARQAAQNLRFGRVTLDPSRPEVPTLLDLDQLVGLLVGSGAEPRSSDAP